MGCSGRAGGQGVCHDARQWGATVANLIANAHPDSSWPFQTPTTSPLPPLQSGALGAEGTNCFDPDLGTFSCTCSPKVPLQLEAATGNCVVRRHLRPLFLSANAPAPLPAAQRSLRCVRCGPASHGAHPHPRLPPTTTTAAPQVPDCVADTTKTGLDYIFAYKCNVYGRKCSCPTDSTCATVTIPPGTKPIGSATNTYVTGPGRVSHDCSLSKMRKRCSLLS